MFEGLMNMPGWKDVYIPHLNHAIEVADHAVHDHRLKDDSMKERNAYYRGLLAALKLIDKIIQEKKWGELYIKDHHIIV